MSQSLESSVKQTLEKKNAEDILIFQILFNLPLITRALGSGICNPTQCSITCSIHQYVQVDVLVCKIRIYMKHIRYS